MSGPPSLEVSRCADCHSLIAPRPGPCPRCGGPTLASERVPAVGRVLVAVQLERPPPGFPAPHRLVLVELIESLRILAVAPDSLPPVGSSVLVERQGERYVARPAPA